MSQTLDAVLSKGQTMPEKNRFPAVLQPYTASSFAQYAEGVGTVRASGGDLGGGSETLLAQPVPIQDGREMEKNQNGMGVGNPGDPAYTIDTTGAQAAGIPFRKSKRACSTTDNESRIPADVTNTLNNFDLGDTRTTHAVVEPFIIKPSELRLTGKITPQNICPTLTAGAKQGDSEPCAVQHIHCSDVAPTVTSSGPPYSRTGNERVEAEALAITFQPGNLRREAGVEPSTTTTTTTLKASAGDQTPHVCHPIAFDTYNQAVSNTNQAIGSSASDVNHYGAVFTPPMAVRRLTCVECERLQGFPDNWSRIPWKGKPETECPDGPRYKACGNSMAVPCMFWIGQRIAAVESSSHA